MQQRLVDYEAVWFQENSKMISKISSNMQEKLSQSLNIYTKEQLQNNFSMKNELCFLTRKVTDITKKNQNLVRTSSYLHHIYITIQLITIQSIIAYN